jgi:hypothetical protein
VSETLRDLGSSHILQATNMEHTSPGDTTIEHADPTAMTIEELRACLEKEGVDYSAIEAVLIAKLKVVRQFQHHGKGPYKRKREDTASLVACPVCEEICLPPTKQCDNGHLVCTACVEKLPVPKICPSCRVSLDHMSRNLTAEQVCASLPMPCSFKEAGCTHTVAYEDYKAHVETCDFRPFQCVTEDCEWQGPLEDFLDHVKQEHDFRSDVSSGWTMNWCKDTIVPRTATGILTGLTDDEQVVFSLVWSRALALRFAFWHVSRSPKDTKQWRIKITMSGPQGLEISRCGPMADLRTKLDLFGKASVGATAFELSNAQTALFDYGLNAETRSLCPVKDFDDPPEGPVLCFAAHIYRND